MKGVRDTGLVFPTTLSNDEKRLKETIEKLRAIRKAIVSTNKVNSGATVGDNLKTERKTTKRHIQQAEEATEEVKRKVLIGAVSFKKADEKKESFKRSSLVGRRRDNDKIKADGDSTINSVELSPCGADDGFDTYKPFSSDSNSTGTLKAAAASDSSDTYRSTSDEFDTYRSTSHSQIQGSSSRSRNISNSRTSSSGFDTCKTPTSDGFDTYKSTGTGDGGGDGFDTYNGSSAFDTYKGTSSTSDGFDSYRPLRSQSSFDAGDGSSPFGGSEQPKPCRGPCLYIRGYDLVADSLRNVFSKYGIINRIFVEERQKSAFITYATTEDAEAAMKEMDGNMVNGITLRVSFARRQNQGGDSGRFRGRPFGRDACNSDRGGRYRGERDGRFRGRFRGRGRGRRRTSESADSWPTTSESRDDVLSVASKTTSDEWPAAEESCIEKDDTWSAAKRSPERRSSFGWQSAEDDKGKGGDGFDTYQPGGKKDDFDTWKYDGADKINGDGFDTWKPCGSDNEGDDSSSTLTCGRGTGDNRRESCGDGRGSVGGDRRASRKPRRGGGNRGDLAWQPRRHDTEQKGDDYWSAGDSSTGRERSGTTAAGSGEKDDFWPSGSRSRSPRGRSKKRDDDDDWPPKRSSREGSPRRKDDDKDDFWPKPSRLSGDKDDDPWPSGGERSRDGDRRAFRGGRRGDRRFGRRGERRPRHDFDDRDAWPAAQSGKSSPCSAWPDAGNKSSSFAWPGSWEDVVASSPPPPPPMSEVQVAWSEATKKATAAAEKAGAPTVTQYKPEIRKQITYSEDDPFA